MAVINPRGGSSLAQVVQTALNIVGPAGVSIVTGGSGNGVQIPDGHLAAVEEALGWTAAESPDVSAAPPTPPTTPPPTPVVEDPPPPPPAEPVAEQAPETPAPADEDEAPAVAEAPAKKATPKKTTSSSRRGQRRGKEG
jgi:outer membrane biosynthesis protein TonB